jgi:hypothetical protein
MTNADRGFLVDAKEHGALCALDRPGGLSHLAARRNVGLGTLILFVDLADF